MQGWRKNMEDAHVYELNLAPDVSLFGIFDGHGGILCFCAAFGDQIV